MIYILIFYLTGIILAINFKFLEGIFFILLILFFFILISKNKKKRRFINKDTSNKKIIIYCIVMFLAFMHSNAKIYSYDFKYSDSDIWGEFIIISKEESSDYYNKYYSKNELGDKFILQVKKTNDIGLEVKNKIYLKGKFELPTIARNEGGFNYRRYLNSQNLYGTITVNKEQIELIEEGKIDFITKLKYMIEDTFTKILPSNYAGIINGMLNGDTKNIKEETLNDFRNSGITHLLAVSGSNIAYIIMFLSLSSNKIFGKYISYYIVIVSIIIFIFVSGASASVARAGIMAILNIVAILFSRKSDTINNVSISALILLIINPLTIYDVGFILSFVGTLGIIFLSKTLIQFLEKFIKVKFISETIGVTVSAQIMLLPILIYYFNTISLFSLITNFLIVPVTGFLTVLGFIILIIGQFSLKLARIGAYAIYALIAFMIKIASFFGNIIWANLLIPTPKIWMIIFYYTIIFLLRFKNLLNFKFKYLPEITIRKLILNLMGIWIIIYVILNQIPRNYIKLNMVDVGQGDCFYIETKNRKSILIDGGGSESSDYDVGENILVPYLLDKGKINIDLAIISHPHEDHIEGILTVVEKLKVKNVMISENIDDNDLTIKLKEICEKRNTKIIKVSAGDSFEVNDIKFDVIYPNLKNKEENINNMSLIIKMKFGDITALFTGDLEYDVEEVIKDNIKADILKVGHHGSITSTSEKFLRKIMPQIALISVGKDNSYGHPSDEVLKRLEKINAKIYRTDELGEVSLKINYKNIIFEN